MLQFLRIARIMSVSPVRTLRASVTYICAGHNISPNTKTKAMIQVWDLLIVSDDLKMSKWMNHLIPSGNLVITRENHSRRAKAPECVQEQLEADTITSGEVLLWLAELLRGERENAKFGTPDGKRSIFRPIGTYIWLGHLTEWVAEVCWK